MFKPDSVIASGLESYSAAFYHGGLDRREGWSRCWPQSIKSPPPLLGYSRRLSSLLTEYGPFNQFLSLHRTKIHKMKHLFLFLTTLLSLSSAFTSVPSAKDELQIRNKLSLYAVAIDTKNFALLDQVFTPDVVVDYRVPNTSILYGLPAVKAYVVKALAGFVTQHTLSTTIVYQTDQKGIVNSTTYLVANYLGQGNLTGQAAYVYGSYSDAWTEQKGHWRSKARTLDLYVCII